MNNLPWIEDYNAIIKGAGLIDLAERTQIELLGIDRVSFLHNLCTNDIRKLARNEGCEAFITNVQGKTLGFVYVFSGPDSLVIETVPGQGEKLRQHFDKYLVREKVEILDRSQDWAGWLLSGPDAEGVLNRASLHGEIPAHRLGSSSAHLAHTPVWIRRVDLAGPFGFLIDSERGEYMYVGSLLQKAGAHRCVREAFEAVRIESGFPLFGRDITENNLPQEVGRDKRAISFTKGCYLGQETVARIDALGHVNKTLVGLRYLQEDVPKPGAIVLAGEEPVGTVTSATWSPRHGAPLALGYVRRGHNLPGNRLASAIGPTEVQVVELATD